MTRKQLLQPVAAICCEIEEAIMTYHSRINPEMIHGEYVDEGFEASVDGVVLVAGTLRIAMSHLLGSPNAEDWNIDSITMESGWDRKILSVPKLRHYVGFGSILERAIHAEIHRYIDTTHTAKIEKRWAELMQEAAE